MSNCWVRQQVASANFNAIMNLGLPFEIKLGLAVKIFICEVNQVNSFNFLDSDRD